MKNLVRVPVREHGYGVTSRRVGLCWQVVLGGKVIATCPDKTSCDTVADSVAATRTQ